MSDLPTGCRAGAGWYARPGLQSNRCALNKESAGEGAELETGCDARTEPHALKPQVRQQTWEKDRWRREIQHLYSAKGVVNRLSLWTTDLLDGHRLGQIARFVDVGATHQGDVIGKQLQRHNVQKRRKRTVVLGQMKDMHPV